MTNVCSCNWDKGKFIVIGIAVLNKLSSAFYCLAVHVLVLEMNKILFFCNISF